MNSDAILAKMSDGELAELLQKTFHGFREWRYKKQPIDILVGPENLLAHNSLIQRWYPKRADLAVSKRERALVIEAILNWLIAYLQKQYETQYPELATQLAQKCGSLKGKITPNQEQQPAPSPVWQCISLRCYYLSGLDEQDILKALGNEQTPSIQPYVVEAMVALVPVLRRSLRESINYEGQQHCLNEAMAQMLKSTFQFFKYFKRDGKNLVDLAGPDSLLANCSLLADQIAENEDSCSLLDLANLSDRALGVESLLYWLLDHLRNQHTADRHNPVDEFEQEWNPLFAEDVTSIDLAPARRYYSVYYLYLLQRTGREVAHRFGTEDKEVYRYFNDAVSEMVPLLRQELQNPTDVNKRRHFLIERLYYKHKPSEQFLLRALSIFRKPIYIQALETLIRRLQKREQSITFVPNYQPLLQDRLIVNLEAEKVIVHPDARAYLTSTWLSMDPVDERYRWHEIAGTYYEEAGEFLEAAYHWRLAQNNEVAAQTVIENYKAIVEASQSEAFYETVALFKPHMITEETWVKLQIATGDAAMLEKDIDTAVRHYTAAVGSAIVSLQAQALYKLGRAVKMRNVDEARLHYEAARHLLINLYQGKQDLAELLVDVLIDEAWIYLQEKPDQEKAKERLEQAKLIVSVLNYEQQARLYNGLARLEKHNDDLDAYLTHALKAYQMAIMTRDVELKMLMTHNLGMGYAWAGNYEPALQYLHESIEFARQLGDRQHDGKCLKVIGACYFFMNEFEKAIVYYKQAFDLFLETGNKNWLGHVCHDIAEAYGELCDVESFDQYKRQAWRYAQEVGDQELETYLTELENKFSYLSYVPSEKYDLVKICSICRLLKNLSPPTEIEVYQLLEDCLPESHEIAELITGLIQPFRPVTAADFRELRDKREAEIAELQQIMAYIEENGAITNQECVTLLYVDARTVLRRLDILLQLQLIEKQGGGRGTRYV